MQRLPKSLITNKLLTTSLADTSYTVPAGSVLTVSALSLNNTSGTVCNVTANAVPPAGSASDANEFLSALPIPAAGAAPTTVPALVGHHFPAGTVIQFSADTGAAVSINFSGYVTS